MFKNIKSLKKGFLYLQRFYHQEIILIILLWIYQSTIWG